MNLRKGLQIKWVNGHGLFWNRERKTISRDIRTE
jgi:hypothetical protein